jgi:hypothetical protein
MAERKKRRVVGPQKRKSSHAHGKGQKRQKISKNGKGECSTCLETGDDMVKCAFCPLVSGILLFLLC